MEPDMRPCPVCGDVYYMFPGELCSAECNDAYTPVNDKQGEETNV